jgi:hypothetical protein
VVHVGLLRFGVVVLDVLDVLVLRVVVVSVLLLYVELLELVPGKHLVSLGSLGGGEGCVSSFLLLHSNLLSLGSPSVYLRTDLLKVSVGVLNVLQGSEGGVDSVLLLHVELLSTVPVN